MTIQTVQPGALALHDMWYPAMVVPVPIGVTHIVRPGRIGRASPAMFAWAQRYFDYKNIVLAVVTKGTDWYVHDVTTTTDYDASRQALSTDARADLLQQAGIQNENAAWHFPSQTMVRGYTELAILLADIRIGQQAIIKPADTTFGRNSQQWLAVQGFTASPLQSRA